MIPSSSRGIAAAHATCKENSKRRIIAAKKGEIQNVAIVGTASSAQAGPLITSPADLM
jgi:hypothetical protein